MNRGEGFAKCQQTRGREEAKNTQNPVNVASLWTATYWKYKKSDQCFDILQISTWKWTKRQVLLWVWKFHNPPSSQKCMSQASYLYQVSFKHESECQAWEKNASTLFLLQMHLFCLSQSNPGKNFVLMIFLQNTKCSKQTFFKKIRTPNLMQVANISLRSKLILLFQNLLENRKLRI